MSWCKLAHNRAGLVSNQDRSVFDTKRTLVSVSVCAKDECIAKAVEYVAGQSNATATYQPDEVRS